MSTSFTPLDHGTKSSRSSIIRCLAWLPVALLAMSLTLLGLIVMAPWALVAWIIGGKQ